jgi:succinylglutamate desuccinylase
MEEITISKNRIICHFKGKEVGPTVVFFAGIHGNEKAGVHALNKIAKDLDNKDINGNVYGVLGNIKGLESGKRFVDKDLNRLWYKEQIISLNSKSKLNTEEKEQKELFQFLKNLLQKHETPIYFIDLHTTSSKTLPFITINDAMINRKFSKLFPVPIILGIEEYLKGPLLSYINQLGYVSLGFEAGQHDDVEAIQNCISFIYLTLIYTRCIDSRLATNLPLYYKQLQQNSKNLMDFFEVAYLYRIKNNDTFKMLPNFESFQPIKKGDKLAKNQNTLITSEHNGRLFMPLYQKQGQEGYFIIKRIAPFFLNISKILRRLKVDTFLVLLPGISWETKEKSTLLVNLKIARFMAKPFFHLLGYRNQEFSKQHLKLYNRERVAKTQMYKQEMWY